ncbi:MAG: beta-glucosidase [Acidobacteria bacterium]|nr:beta-glucosidase [Acidobacteriota bacterium]
MLLAAAAAQAVLLHAQQYTFGTTVVSNAGFQGRIHHIKENADRLPGFRGKPVGKVYTNNLNIWPQRFDEGFPGITGRFEWFAIDYHGKLWIEHEGVYRFSLLSDDGVRIEIDDETVVEMEGQHSSTAASGSARLSRGVHRLRVSYFQGPRDTVALVVAVALPEQPWKILDLRDFMPPADPSQWREGEISEVRVGTNPYTESDGRRCRR